MIWPVHTCTTSLGKPDAFDTRLHKCVRAYYYSVLKRLHTARIESWTGCPELVRLRRFFEFQWMPAVSDCRVSRGV